jgi:hypothetical protein
VRYGYRPKNRLSMEHVISVRWALRLKKELVYITKYNTAQNIESP